MCREEVPGSLSISVNKDAILCNILMQLFKSLFKRELERQSTDHFQQFIMAISNDLIGV